MIRNLIMASVKEEVIPFTQRYYSNTSLVIPYNTDVTITGKGGRGTTSSSYTWVMGEAATGTNGYGTLRSSDSAGGESWPYNIFGHGVYNEGYLGRLSSTSNDGDYLTYTFDDNPSGHPYNYVVFRVNSNGYRDYTYTYTSGSPSRAVSNSFSTYFAGGYGGAARVSTKTVRARKNETVTITVASGGYVDISYG